MYDSGLLFYRELGRRCLCESILSEPDGIQPACISIEKREVPLEPATNHPRKALLGNPEYEIEL